MHGSGRACCARRPFVCRMPDKPSSHWKAVSTWPTIAAHAAALSALRVHGYRSENRYLVLQCLEHTLGFQPQQWLLLDQAHKKRNLAEYEGDLDVTEGFVEELIEHVAYLIAAAQALEAAS